MNTQTQIQTQSNERSVETVQQQLNYIKRKLNERTALSNISNYANIAQKLSNGSINIELDSVNKIINFSNGINKLWINISNKTFNNIVSLIFNDGSLINGLVTNDNIDDAKDSPDDYTNHAISAETFIDYINDCDDKYAAKEHTHAINDVTNLQSSLNGKADANHSHAINDVTNLQSSLNGKADANHTHTLSDISDYTSTDLSNCAKLNVSNTFNTDQTINGNLNVNGFAIHQLQPNLATGSYPYYAVGKTRSNGQCFQMEYNYKSNVDQQQMIMGIYGYPQISIRSDRTLFNGMIESNASITTSSTITAGQLETTSDLPSTAIGSNLGTAIVKLVLQSVYPVGAVYISFTSTSPDTLFGFGTWVQIVDRFLYCANSSNVTAGKSNHTHIYGIQYAGWQSEVHGWSGDSIQLYDNGSWGGKVQNVGSVTQKSWYASSDNHNMARYSAAANVETVNHMPPYITCYAWRRTA